MDLFCCIRYPLSANYATGKIIAITFKLQVHQRILLCCFGHRTQLNEKIVDFNLLFLSCTIYSLLLLAATIRVCFTWNYAFNYFSKSVSSSVISKKTSKLNMYCQKM